MNCTLKLILMQYFKNVKNFLIQYISEKVCVVEIGLAINLRHCPFNFFSGLSFQIRVFNCITVNNLL